MDCCTPNQDQPTADAECCAVPQSESAKAGCPSCQQKGRVVDHITLKALLTSSALKRLSSNPYRFCPSADCDVVYYAAGSTFRTEDVTAPVWQKTDDPSVWVCYCFQHSEQSIRKQIALTGESTAAEEIKTLVHDGRCACEVRNPQGSCCLGNVAQVLKQIRSGMAVVSGKVGQ